jgi:S-adenosylmethionine:tRNA ribosyltransferase-isomerase
MITPFLISPKGERLLQFQFLPSAKSEQTPSPLGEGWEGGIREREKKEVAYEILCGKKRNMNELNINDYDYDLPEDRIAQYPAAERDASKLLVFKNGIISQDTFRNIDQHLPEGSLLIFNNTRVIRARLLFRKGSGALIEILCLEPLLPYDYSLSFGSKESVEWKCIIGNLKKWKTGTLSTSFIVNGVNKNLYAEKLLSEGEAWRIRFSWDDLNLSFAEVIEGCGHIPLPPYINRSDENEDNIRYQTVYSSVDGSVAAPTAGLHFTASVMEKLRSEGIKTAEITLHVGAGTFKPIKSENIYEHEMHTEHFFADKKTIKLLLENKGKIIPVGTTSVRTLESLYWLGVKIISEPGLSFTEIALKQWEAYELPQEFSSVQAIEGLLSFMNKNQLNTLLASTSILIKPGYQFRMTNGIITNFHQPRSTLLLLISAFTGKSWKELYIFALENNFRFLSYGDSSLLLK